MSCLLWLKNVLSRRSQVAKIGAILLLCLINSHAQAIALTSTENPSYDGSYTLALGSSIWEPFAPYGGGDGVLTERVNGATTPSDIPINKNATSISLSGRSVGSYSYQVRVCGQYAPTNGGCITTDYLTVNVQQLGIVTLGALPNTLTSGMINLTWSSVVGASSYKLYEKKDSGSLIHIGTFSSGSAALSRSTGLYQYTVKACNSLQCSDDATSNPIKVAITPPSPQSLSIPNTLEPGNAVINWGVSSNVKYYKLQMSRGDQDWVEIYKGGLNTYTQTLLSGNYSFRISACAETQGFESCSSWLNTSPVSVRIKSANYSKDDYHFYIGDINNDGLFDLLLTPKAKIILIHGDIITPIAIFPKKESLAYLGQANGFYASAQVWNISDGLLSSLTEYESPTLFFQLNEQTIASVIEPVLAETKGVLEDEIDEEVVADRVLDEDLDQVGAVPDSFDVDNNGNVNYVMPIAVPPGTNGMQPSLALNYNSAEGYGNLGYGWSISGQSKVTRCNRSIAIDGYNRSVSLDENDAYCLDGERLILVDDANRTIYESNSKEYRTEKESAQRVIGFYNSSSSTEPESFKVWDKSGRISEYGNTSDSNIKAKTLRKISTSSWEVVTSVWAINKIQDRNSNYITYIYDQSNVSASNTATVEYYTLKEIRYTGNEGTGLLPYNKVYFEYESRPTKDVSSTYTNGTFIHSKRLKRIVNHLGDQVVSSYTLNYDAEGLFDRSKLQNVILCGQDEYTCLPSTNFDWTSGGEAGFTDGVGDGDYYLDGEKWDSLDTVTETRRFGDGHLHFNSNDLSSVVTGDFNGDGVTDLYVIKGRPDHVYSGFAEDIIYLFQADGSRPKQIPGISSFIVGQLCTTSANYESCIESAARRSGSISRLQFGDFNGDGITDIYEFVSPPFCDLNSLTLFQNKADRVYLFQSDGSFQSHDGLPREEFKLQPGSCYIEDGVIYPLADTPVLNQQLAAIRIADFNGDGISDIYNIRNGSQKVYLFDKNGKPQSAITASQITFDNVPFRNSESTFHNFARIKVGDFNGDGISDIYFVRGLGGANWTGYDDGYFTDKMYLFNSNGQVEKIIDGAITYVSDIPSEAMEDLNRIKFGDFNGDGRTDIYVIDGANRTWPSEYASYNQYDFNNFLNQESQPTNDFIYYLTASDELRYGPGLNTSVFSVAVQGTTCRDIGVFGARESVPMSYTDNNGNEATRMSHGRPGIEGIQICFPNFSPIFNVFMNRYLFADFDGDGTTDIYRVDPRKSSGNFDSLSLFGRSGNVVVETAGENIGMRAPTTISSWPTDPFFWTNTQLDLQRFRFGDFNGDGVTDIYHLGGQVDMNDRLFFGASKPVKLKSITNGVGAKTSIEYTESTDDTVVTREHDSENRASKSARLVVSHVETSNGIGGVTGKRYHYTGLKSDAKQRSLGYRKIDITDDHDNGFITSTEFFQGFPFTGLLKQRTVTSKANQNVVSDSTIESSDLVACYSMGPESSYPYNAYPKMVTTKTFDLESGSLIKTQIKTTELSGDCLGNVELSKDLALSPTGDQYSTSTVNDFDQYMDLDNWLVSRSREIVITSTAPFADGGVDTHVKTIVQAFYPNLLALDTITEYPNSIEAQTQKFVYDDYGNVTILAVCGGDNCTAQTAGARVSKSIYHDGTNGIDGQFVDYTQNAEGHLNTYKFDARFGKPTREENHDGLATCTQYNPFGQPIIIKEFCGKPKEVLTLFIRGSVTSHESAPNAVYFERTGTQGGGYSQVYFDSLNREVRKQTLGFDGKWVAVDIVYDDLGRIEKQSEPYFLDIEQPSWKQSIFDDLGRVLEYTPADGYSKTSITYTGTTKTTVRAVAGVERTTKEIFNVIGQTNEVIDAEYNSTKYKYYANGLLYKTIDPSLNEIVLTYDDRGNKVTMTDPDMGSWSYTYTDFDELETQTDAKNSVTYFKYDKIGRLTLRTFDYGASSANSSTWVYDTASGASTGQLHTEFDDSGYQKAYSYDDYGRVLDAVEAIPGHNSDFISSWSYDNYSRIDKITYPSRNFAVKHRYSENTGQLTQVFSSGVDAKVYWSLTEANARGQIQEELFGNRVISVRDYNPNNGWLRSTETRSSSALIDTPIHSMSYEFDDVGSIDWRKNNLSGVLEDFEYDVLDRIRSSTVAGTTTSYDYDALGNITYKSDVGTYSYDDTCATNGVKAGPHAVSSVSGPQGGSYCYDLNGNMITDGQQLIGYTPDNKPNSFTRQGIKVAEFFYSPSRNRNKKTFGSKSLYYIGQDEVGKVLYEKELGGSSPIERHYIYAGDLAIAVMARKGGVDEFEYQHRDHLNSIEAITNQRGELVVAKSFDSFGRPRNEDWSALGTFEIKGQEGFRGYTGHEHIDETGLIHMNGRVYNPILGRFLSPDPNIQFAKVQQSYNRYSYVSNNPLKYTDPTGYFLEWITQVFAAFTNHQEEEKEVAQSDNSEKDKLEGKKSEVEASGSGRSGGVTPGGTVDSGGFANWLSESWYRSFGSGEIRLNNIKKYSCYSGCSDRPLSDEQRVLYGAAKELTGGLLGAAAPGEVVMFGLSVSATARITTTTRYRAAGDVAEDVAKGRLRIDSGNFSQSEIDAAWHMASQGKKVHLRQPVGTRAGGGTSDMLVDGIRYDVYTPTSGNPSRIISAIAKKNSQAEGIVLDLRNSSVTAEQLGNVLGRVNGAGATNIKDIVIMGN